MKKVFLCMMAFFFASICSATAGFSFYIGSTGVDCYADGTPVLPGERYGLVYVAPGKAFGGIYSDGTLKDEIDNTLFPIAVRADAGSRLPICSYTMDGAYAGGTFYLVVFDTRTPDGGVNGSVVNGWGIAASLAVPASSAGAAKRAEIVGPLAASSSAAVSSSATLAPSVPAGAVIEKMDFVGDEVWLTVRNTGSAAYYAAAGAENLDASSFETQGVKTAVKGAAAADDTIIVKFPKNDKNAYFFKVKGGTLMNL